MNRGYAHPECWPTRQQELLLRAALLPGRRGIDAWQEWRRQVDPTRLDSDCDKILPQLYRNLRDQGVSDPLMDWLKRTHLRAWQENQVRLHALAGILRALHDAGVETVLLKGVAMVARYYRDCGLRPMEDMDILVPRPQVSKAFGLLRTLGFTPYYDRSEADELLVGPGCCFIDAAGRQVDLHWYVFHASFGPEADAEFWAGSEPITIRGVPSRTLNAADQLLHVCEHGIANPPATMRWVADAMAILREAPGGMDWERLLEQARRRWLISMLRAALTYLRDTVDAPVPREVLQRLDDIRPSRVERLVDEARLNARGPWLRLCVRYLDHCASLPSEAGLLRRLAGFPGYLLRRWRISWWWLPVAAVRRAVCVAIAKITGHQPQVPLTHPTAPASRSDS